MRYDSEHKERTRQRVLSEAAAAIRAHGPDGLSVAALMGKAGLTHGGFYAHFKSKDDLIAQAISAMFEQSRLKFDARTEQKDPATALNHYIDMYVSQRHRDGPENGCPLPALSGDLARMPTKARKRFTTGFTNLTTNVAALLKGLNQPQPERLAESMIAEMVGAIALSRALEDTDASNRILETTRAALKARIGLKT